jgi:hypothetical protein
MSDGWPKLFEEMIVAVRFKANPIIDLDGPFRETSIGIFENRGSENSLKCEVPKFHWDKHEVMALRSRGTEEGKLCKGPKHPSRSQRRI